MPTHRTSLLGLAALIASGSLSAQALALPAGWEAPVDLSEPGVVALAPSAASNARGDLAVGWIAVTPDGRRRIQAAVHPAGATEWSRPFGIGPVTDRADGVAVALDADGRLLVAWKTGARATPRRVVARAAIVSADARRRTVRVLGRSDGRFPAFIVAPAVAFTGTGRAVVAWTAPAPFSSRRAFVSIAPRAGAFEPARRLDPAPRAGAEPGCVSGGVRLAVRPRGGVVAWWDCFDDTRDYELTVAFAGPSGRFGAPEGTGVVGRGSTGTALAPGVGKSVVGTWAENDDDEFGSHLRSLVRTGSARWDSEDVRVVPPAGQSDSTPFPYAQSPTLVAGAPATGYVSAWISPNEGGAYRDRVWAASGPDGAAAFAIAGPIGPLAPEAASADLAGVGLTTARTAVVVWAQESALQAGARSIWTAARPGPAAAFGAAEEADLVGEVIGAPAFSLGSGGAGAVAWSRGPLSDATVRASAIRVP